MASRQEQTNNAKVGRAASDKLLDRDTGEPRPAWMSTPALLPKRPPPMRFPDRRGSRREES